MAEKKVSIIIVNWNSGKYLSECIESVFKSDFDLSLLEIIIVDNASDDNSLENIFESENLKIIKNNTNIGFGAACNIAFNISTGKYKLLLNPDTKVYSDTIRNSVEFMDNNSDIAVLGVRQVNFDEKTLVSCSRFPKLYNFIYDIFGLSKIFPGIFHSATLMLDWDHEKSAFVDQVMGAYMFIRSEILEETGLMDERFFVYYEDMDLSYRIHKIGGKIFYNSDIKIFHYGGGTSETVKDYRLFYSLRSRLTYADKYFNKISLIILFSFTLIIEPFTRIIFSLLKFNIIDIKGIVKGYKLLYFSIFTKQKNDN